MARPLSSPLHVARHMMATDKSLLFFIEVDLGGGDFLRMVKNSDHVFADGKRWAAAQLEITVPTEDSEGSMGELSFAVPSISRMPMTWIENDGPDGKPVLLGRPITCWLQPETAFAAFAPGLSWRHRILAADVDDERATLRCGHPADLIRCPSQLYDRRRFPQLRASGGLSNGV